LCRYLRQLYRLSILLKLIQGFVWLLGWTLDPNNNRLLLSGLFGHRLFLLFFALPDLSLRVFELLGVLLLLFFH
jgi:hypothetical protein